MKTSFLSKLVLLFVFSVFLQSCTADALPDDPEASSNKTMVKPTNVSAEVSADLEPNTPKLR